MVKSPKRIAKSFVLDADVVQMLRDLKLELHSKSEAYALTVAIREAWKARFEEGGKR